MEAWESPKPLIIGRENGQIELRNENTGEITFKLALGCKLGRLFQFDFRQTGQP